MTKKFFLRVGVVNSFIQFSESPSTSSTFWRAHNFCEITIFVFYEFEINSIMP